MKEFIDKLIERLEELQNYACFPSEFVSEEQEKVYSYFAKKLTEILKFAEEYKLFGNTEQVKVSEMPTGWKENIIERFERVE